MQELISVFPTPRGQIRFAMNCTSFNQYLSESDVEISSASTILEYIAYEMSGAHPYEEQVSPVTMERFMKKFN